MSKKQKLVFAVAVVAGLAAVTVWYSFRHGVAVLQPKGTIGNQEKHLIVFAAALSLIVIIPVYAMLIGFAWTYREGNKKAVYQPEFDHSRKLESIWWGVPMALITILGVVTWRSAHQLDPFRPLSGPPPLTIQVVALQWKWLFIYPKQNIASVNYIQIPLNTPVRFEITSDAPMNSFWIPRLGGQIYAMSGMATDLNLQASQAGTYDGTSANISGAGFSGMDFKVRADSQAAFNHWVDAAKNSSTQLTAKAYQHLSAPSQTNPVHLFASAQTGLFDSIVDKYLAPLSISPESSR